jgi:molecular chaperone DnaK (HSP70)
MLAAAKAGLGEVRLLDEPLATAHAYIACGTRCERAFVYDLGGGTFDCASRTALRAHPCCSRTRATSHSAATTSINGLAAWVAEHGDREAQLGPSRSYAEVYDRVLSECELAKIELATADSRRVPVGQVDPDCPAPDEPIAITRGLLGDAVPRAAPALVLGL